MHWLFCYLDTAVTAGNSPIEGHIRVYLVLSRFNSNNIKFKLIGKHNVIMHGALMHHE